MRTLTIDLLLFSILKYYVQYFNIFNQFSILHNRTVNNINKDINYKKTNFDA